MRRAGSAASKIRKHMPCQLFTSAGLRRLKNLGHSPLDIYDKEIAWCYIPCLNYTKLKNLRSI